MDVFFQWMITIKEISMLYFDRKNRMYLHASRKSICALTGNRFTRSIFFRQITSTKYIPGNAAIDTPPKIFLRLTTPPKNGDVVFSQCGRNLILGTVNIAGCPTNLKKNIFKKMNQHRKKRMWKRSVNFKMSFWCLQISQKKKSWK